MLPAPHVARFGLLQRFSLTAIVLCLTAAGCKPASADPPAVVSVAPSASPPPLCTHPPGERFCKDNHVFSCEKGKPVRQQACWNIERCDAGKCLPNCPTGEVYIPPTGPDGFTMGKGKLGRRDTPHPVVLTQPFCMDETEVTSGAYAKCIDAGKCKEPHKWDPYASYPRHPDHPVNLVSWPKAKQYCETLGKTLPTEAQWEWAATGGDGRLWPWGDEPPTCFDHRADFTPGGAPKSTPGGDVGCHGGGPSPVKAHPEGAKVWPTGKLFDLAGNVWEWTLDFASPYPSERVVDPEVDRIPGKPDMTVRSIRGGGWNRSAIGCSTWFRGEATQRYQVPGLGFRCVRRAAER